MSPSRLSVIVTTRPRASPPSTLSRRSRHDHGPRRPPMLLSRERSVPEAPAVLPFRRGQRVRVCRHGLPRDVSPAGNRDLRTPVRDQASQTLGSGPIRSAAARRRGVLELGAATGCRTPQPLRGTVAQRVQVERDAEELRRLGEPVVRQRTHLAVNCAPVASRARHSAACSATRTERVREPNGPRFPPAARGSLPPRVTLSAGQAQRRASPQPQPRRTAARSRRSRPRPAPGSERIPSSTR